MSDSKANLLEAVFEHYDLDYPTGYGERSWKCPVHDDTHASASINTNTGLWTCFACGAGGDGYTIIEIREGCSFADANRIAAGIYDGGDGEVRGSVSPITGSRVPAPQKHRSGKGGTYVPPWSRL